LRENWGEADKMGHTGITLGVGKRRGHSVVEESVDGTDKAISKMVEEV
jgi:hypothetical protein